MAMAAVDMTIMSLATSFHPLVRSRTQLDRARDGRSRASACTETSAKITRHSGFVAARDCAPHAVHAASQVRSGSFVLQTEQEHAHPQFTLPAVEMGK